MPRTFSILHVSDLHVADEDVGTCLGTDAKTVPYFSKLEKAAGKHHFAKIDAIVATGDFVHKGLYKNFDRARDVLEQLASTFSASLKCVVPCCGNHDYERRFQTRGKVDEARAFYRRFADELAEPADVPDGFGQSVRIYRLPNVPLTFFSIDSTLGDVDDMPGLLSKEGRNHMDILHRLAELISAERQSRFCCLLSHYPISDPPESQKLRERFGKDHVPRHVATTLVDLRKKISSHETGKPLIGFYGDLHHPISWDPLRHGDGPPFFQFCSPRLDSPSKIDREWQIHQGVRFLRADFEGSRLEAVRFDFEDDQALSVDPDFGDWVAKDIRRWTKKKWSEGRRLSPISSWAPKGKSQKNLDTDANGDDINDAPSDSDKELPILVRSEIDRKRLVDDVRLRTHGDFIRMVHIRLGPLMNDRDLMSYVISDFAAWVKRTGMGANGRTEETVLLGVDSWGGWLASEVGFRCGINSSPISIRGVDTTAAVAKAFSRHKILRSARTSGCKDVVIVTDVLATWDTVCRVQSATKSILGTDDTRYWVLGFIAAKKNLATRADIKTRFSGSHVVLRDFPMPILPEGQLPITPTTVSRPVISDVHGT